MRGRAWLVMVYAAAALLGRWPAWAQAMSADEIVTRMMQHDAERRAALAGSTRSDRTVPHGIYRGPIGERHAEMRVRMNYAAPDKKSFTVESRSRDRRSSATRYCES